GEQQSIAGAGLRLTAANRHIADEATTNKLAEFTAANIDRRIELQLRPAWRVEQNHPLLAADFFLGAKDDRAWLELHATPFERAIILHQQHHLVGFDNLRPLPLPCSLVGKSLADQAIVS